MRSNLNLVWGAVMFLTVFATLTPSSEAQGRVKWRYRAQADYFSMRPVVAPDGTVYAVDIAGTLHAIASDGTPRWTLPGPTASR